MSKCLKYQSNEVGKSLKSPSVEVTKSLKYQGIKVFGSPSRDLRLQDDCLAK